LSWADAQGNVWARARARCCVVGAVGGRGAHDSVLFALGRTCAPWCFLAIRWLYRAPGSTPRIRRGFVYTWLGFGASTSFLLVVPSPTSPRAGWWRAIRRGPAPRRTGPGGPLSGAAPTAGAVAGHRLGLSFGLGGREVVPTFPRRRGFGSFAVCGVPASPALPAIGPPATQHRCNLQPTCTWVRPSGATSSKRVRFERRKPARGRHESSITGDSLVDGHGSSSWVTFVPAPRSAISAALRERGSFFVHRQITSIKLRAPDAWIRATLRGAGESASLRNEASAHWPDAFDLARKSTMPVAARHADKAHGQDVFNARSPGAAIPSGRAGRAPRASAKRAVKDAAPPWTSTFQIFRGHVPWRTDGSVSIEFARTGISQSLRASSSIGRDVGVST